MNDYPEPVMPAGLEEAFRAVYRALADIPQTYLTQKPEPEADLYATEVIARIPSLAEEAEMTGVAHLGPRISWQSESHELGAWEPIVAGIDLDGGHRDFGAQLGKYGDWYDSPLERAARAYRRECRWDFAPGEDGMWLLMLAPTSAVSGGTDSWTGETYPWSYSGNVVGFVILRDRDEDGTYESVGHAWTARGWRRRGIARRLHAEARARFHYQHVEGPLTQDGAAFLKACPELREDHLPAQSFAAAVDDARPKETR